MLWEHIRCEEFRDEVEKCNRVCVIPIGCVEAHGVHLPLGCDNFIAREFCIRAAEINPVCIFPTLPFGEKCGAGEFDGTIIFPHSLVIKILEQCCEEAARNGFKKILILSGHGGNANIINGFLRGVLFKKPDYLVYHYNQNLTTPAELLKEVDKYPYLTQEDISILHEYADNRIQDGHGGFSESGELYDICPELVRLDRMDALDSKNTHRFDEFSKRGIISSFNWMGNYPNSYGSEKHDGLNERIAKALAQKTVETTAEVFRFLREENISDEYQREWMAKQ